MKNQTVQKRILLNELFDVYAPFLTKTQQQYFILYYHENYSLGEIAQLTNVSRTAIHQRLLSVEKRLRMYEEKTHWAAKNTLINETIQLLQKQENLQELYKKWKKLMMKRTNQNGI